MGNEMRNRPSRWPYTEETLTRRRLLREEEGRAVPPSPEPMLTCSPAVARITFWCAYGLLAVIFAAVVIHWLRGGAA